MKIIYKLSFFFAVLLSVSSCNLDLNSTSTIPIESPEDVFETYADATRFSSGLTSYFRSTTYGIYAQAADIQGDMFNAAIGNGNQVGSLHTMSNRFTPSDYDITDIWNGYYGAISGYNFFLENIHYVQDNKDLTLDQRKQINVWKGYAFFYRAHNYMELTKKFCADYEPASAATELGLPLVSKYDVTAKPARATLQATVDFIKNDLDSAAKYLTSVAGQVRSTVPTKDALTALRARYALYTHEWKVAADYAGAVIASNTYSLAMDATQMSDEWINETGPESIMQLYSSLTESPRSMSYFIGSFAGTYSGEYVYSPLYLPTKRLYDLYEAKDIRRPIYLSEQYIYPGGVLTQMPVFTKYRGNPALTSAPYYTSLNQAKIFRIAEMYLIKAEAEVQGGLGDPAATLNALQIARGATPTTGTMADVQKEWARETVGEGVRIECLKRWHLGFENRPALNSNVVTIAAGYTTIKVEADSRYFNWPIPTNDIIYNKNMVQNKGW